MGEPEHCGRDQERDQRNLSRNWLKFWMEKLFPVSNDESQSPGSCPLEQKGLQKEKCSSKGANAGSMEQLPRVSSGFGQVGAVPLMLWGGREGYGVGPLGGTGKEGWVVLWQ